MVSIAAIAAAARVVVIAWAASRFPASGDGQYYAKLADRIAHGLGYTWAWPDGVVTYAAHYPVGYPALIALADLVLGPSVASAMWLNGLLGTLAALAAHQILLPRTTPRRAFLGALVVALHPALLMYTPALMTEGVTASLLVIALALVRGRTRAAFFFGALVLGIATLVRPQCLLLAPVLGLVAGIPIAPGTSGRPWKRLVVRALAATAIVLGVCAPWTARNCTRMNRCALVSVNGGWNLLIGAQTTSGGWEELVVPENCRDVFDEAEKDACFDGAAKKTIAASPGSWLARTPQKLAVTFDYFGAAPWYLHLANGASFTEEDKILLGTVETIASRAMLAAAILVLGFVAARRKGRSPVWTWALVVTTALAFYFALSRHAWPAYGLLVVLGAVAYARTRDRLVGFTVAIVAATMITHAVFFGAGRYGLVVVPFVSMIPFGERSRKQNARSPK
ncbi:hypothetical protein BH09MYX1_BH09MYX1_64700 [soil metagenome]